MFATRGVGTDRTRFHVLGTIERQLNAIPARFFQHLLGGRAIGQIADGLLLCFALFLFDRHDHSFRGKVVCFNIPIC
jgi:hypothetical protein